MQRSSTIAKWIDIRGNQINNQIKQGLKILMRGKNITNSC